MELQKVHYRAQNILSCVPNLGQISPYHPYSCKTSFNAILLSKPRSCKWLLSFQISPNKTRHGFIFSPWVPHVQPILSSMIWSP